MRHGYRNRTFQRSYNERKALINSLAKSVIINERISTTVQKAKEAVKLVDKLITLGKNGDLHARRLAYETLQDRNLIKLLFEDIAPRFKNRSGGYTRVLFSGFRKGDGAQMAILELVERKEKIKEAKKKEKKKKIEETVKEKPSEKLKEEPKEKLEKKEAPTELKEVKHEVAPPDKERHKKAVKEEPKRKLLGGFQKFFKKERDSL